MKKKEQNSIVLNQTSTKSIPPKSSFYLAQRYPNYDLESNQNSSVIESEQLDSASTQFLPSLAMPSATINEKFRKSNLNKIQKYSLKVIEKLKSQQSSSIFSQNQMSKFKSIDTTQRRKKKADDASVGDSFQVPKKTTTALGSFIDGNKSPLKGDSTTKFPTFHQQRSGQFNHQSLFTSLVNSKCNSGDLEVSPIRKDKSRHLYQDTSRLLVNLSLDSTVNTGKTSPVNEQGPAVLLNRNSPSLLNQSSSQFTYSQLLNPNHIIRPTNVKIETNSPVADRERALQKQNQRIFIENNMRSPVQQILDQKKLSFRRVQDSLQSMRTLEKYKKASTFMNALDFKPVDERNKEKWEKYLQKRIKFRKESAKKKPKPFPSKTTEAQKNSFRALTRKASKPSVDTGLSRLPSKSPPKKKKQLQNRLAVHSPSSQTPSGAAQTPISPSKTPVRMTPSKRNFDFGVEQSPIRHQSGGSILSKFSKKQEDPKLRTQGRFQVSIPKKTDPKGFLLIQEPSAESPLSRTKTSAGGGIPLSPGLKRKVTSSRLNKSLSIRSPSGRDTDRSDNQSSSMREEDRVRRQQQRVENQKQMRLNYEEFDEADINGNKTLGSSMSFVKENLARMRRTIANHGISDALLQDRRPLKNTQDLKKKKKDLRYDFDTLQRCEKVTEDEEEKALQNFEKLKAYHNYRHHQNFELMLFQEEASSLDHLINFHVIRPDEMKDLEQVKKEENEFKRGMHHRRNQSLSCKIKKWKDRIDHLVKQQQQEEDREYYEEARQSLGTGTTDSDYIQNTDPSLSGLPPSASLQGKSLVQNFVKYNRAKQRKSPDIQEMKRFWEGLNKQSQMKILQVQRTTDEISRREEIQRSNNKWTEFKFRRALVVDKFLTLKKQGVQTHMLIASLTASKIVKKLAATYKEHRGARLRRQRAVFVICYLKIKWRRFMRRMRNDVNLIILNRLRHAFMFVVVPFKSETEIKVASDSGCASWTNIGKRVSFADRKEEERIRKIREMQKLQRRKARGSDDDEQSSDSERSTPSPPLQLPKFQMTFKNLIEHRALKDVLKPFLLDQIYSSLILTKMRRTYELLAGLSKRLKLRLLAKRAQEEALARHWEFQLNRCMKIANKNNNTQLAEFLTRFTEIPEEVKDYVLQEILLRSRLKAKVAYYQWRLMYRREEMDKEQVETNLNQSIEHINSTVDFTARANIVTTKTSAMTFNQEVELGLINKKTGMMRSHPWKLNSFWGIGWPHPFPDERPMVDPSQDKYEDDNVYQESRYFDEHCPTTIYLPNRLLIIKIMRGCLACELPAELWVYSLSYEAET